MFLNNQSTKENPEKLSSVNIGTNERNISLLLGTVCLIVGLRRRGWAYVLLLVGGKMLYRGITGHSLIYKMLDINTAVKTNPYAVNVPHEQGIRVSQSVTINRPVEDLYHFWRNFENLPRFMKHIQEVHIIDDKRSHWKVQGPGGIGIEWDAEIINEEAYEVIAWRSLADASIAHAGSVRFKAVPGQQGVELLVTMEYISPAGKLGDVIAKLLGEAPEQQIAEDLLSFKQLMEGEEISSENGASGNTRNKLT